LQLKRAERDKRDIDLTPTRYLGSPLWNGTFMRTKTHSKVADEQLKRFFLKINRGQGMGALTD
jgi:hypothetical protein